MDTRGRNGWHTTEPWHNSPLPEGVSHAVTVPPGRGGGWVRALEAPQDKHGQEHRTGTSRAEQTDRDHGGAGSSGSHGGAGSSGGHGGAGSSGGHGGAGSSGGHGRWSLGPWPQSPRPGPYSRNSYYPPKISLGKWGGIRSPLGLNRQDSTNKTGKPSRARPDRTGHPTGTGSPPGLARRLRLLLGMTRSQRPSQGPSATASTSATRGQAARMASMATTRGATCPRHDMVL